MATLIHCQTCGEKISSNARSCPHCGELSKKPSSLPYKINAIFWSGVLLIAIISTVANLNSTQSPATQTQVVVNTPSAPASNPLTELENETPSDLVPQGELAEMFNLGSDYTDLQRENKLKEITGKVVEWQLPVYEISRSGSAYRVRTMGDDVVRTSIYITTRNDQEKQIIEALKTGHTISFKGQITDSSSRDLEIKPAILFNPIKAESIAPIDKQPEVHEEEVDEEEFAEKPAAHDAQPTVNTEETQKPKVEDVTWLGNWGGDIEAKVTSENCTDSDFLKQGYTHFASSSIPEARLKKAGDAYFVSGGRAITVIGCWFKKHGGVIHMKMKRKHDGKVWEQDHDVYDARAWSPVANDNGNGHFKYMLDEANNRINVVWNGATKDIRKALLPEQKQWLKQRESDCPLKSTEEYADRLRCMATMTDGRTEGLKQKIAAMLNN